MFVLKGFTAKELTTKYVELEVVGKTDEGKIVIGGAVLAGRQGVCSVYNFSLLNYYLRYNKRKRTFLQKNKK